MSIAKYIAKICGIKEASELWQDFVRRVGKSPSDNFMQKIEHFYAEAFADYL